MPVPRTTPVTTVRPAVLVAAAAALSVALGGCASAPAAPKPGASPAATTTGTASATPSASDAAAGHRARNLTATAQVKDGLIQAWTGDRHIEAGDVTGTAPGSVYYGYLPATRTYWAVASFTPAPSLRAPASSAAAVFDDQPWVLRSSPGQGWTVVGDTSGQPCARLLPAAVARVWGLSATSTCSPTPPRWFVALRYTKDVNLSHSSAGVAAIGDIAHWVPGGPDDGHYAISRQRVTLTLLPRKTSTSPRRTTVYVLRSRPGLGWHRVDLLAFPRALRRDHYGRIFTVTGTDDHVRELHEMYHP